jgi:peptidoglycan/LPS O-acetylase OafA/YrhL
MKASARNIYFPSLNGLRAIAAFGVLFTHVERYLQIAKRPYAVSIFFNSFLGGLAVSFFFVLSGFLITYLLLEERKLTGDIRIKNFLLKRALRILPLYLVVLSSGYLVSEVILHSTSTNIWTDGFMLNLLLLPNIAFAFGMIPEILIQIWSIGTEAQFYLLWPFVVRRNSPAGLFRIILVIIVVWLAARGILWLTGAAHSPWNVILFRTRIDCMAIGGLAASCLFYQHLAADLWRRFMDWIHHAATPWFLGIVFLLLVAISVRFSASLYLCYAILFAIVILRVIHHPVYFLELSVMKWLGKISYGIYLLHHFCVYFVFWIFSGLLKFPEYPIWGDLFYFLMAGILSTVCAGISYQFFEKRFLKIAHTL